MTNPFDALNERTDDELRDLLDRILPEVQAAAQDVLDARARARARSTPTVHGVRCPPGCCGAGVRQWR
jgi:hypothetical protein